MQAINHVATALLFKRAFPKTPLWGLIIAVEAVEYLWVGLNLAGIERTIINADMTSVADIHLVHMPFSHSILSSVLLALLVSGMMFWRYGRQRGWVALAIGLAILSHILLDLLVHAPDIALAPFLNGEKYGSGLYATLPLLALGVETCWGLLCWIIYRGGWAMLGLIVVFNAGSIPFYSAGLNTGEAALAGQSATFAVIILVQMVVTSVLVWYIARRDEVAVAT